MFLHNSVSQFWDHKWKLESNSIIQKITVNLQEADLCVVSWTSTPVVFGGFL